MLQLLQAFSSMRGIKMMENDYELVYLAQENNEFAQEYLVSKYKYVINIIINKNLVRVKALKLDKEDVYNIGLYALHQAIKLYNNEDDVTFVSFATILINRRINGYFKLNSRKKDTVFLNSVSLYDENINKNKLLNVTFDPDSMIEKKENHRELQSKILNQLTGLEKSIYKLMTEFDADEIAQILNIDIKSVYNAITRIRNKTSKMLAKS